MIRDARFAFRIHENNSIFSSTAVMERESEKSDSTGEKGAWNFDRGFVNNVVSETKASGLTITAGNLIKE